MKSSFVWHRKAQLGFGAAILTLLGSGVISYRALVISNQSQGWVRHTDQVLEELQELLSAIQSIESSNRGFVLTGDKSYIESVKVNILREAQAEGSIEQLTVDNVAQQSRVPLLKNLLAQKIRFSESVIDLRQAKGMEAAAALIGERRGQQIMGEIQDLVLEMQDEEQRLLRVRNAGASRQLEHTKIVLVLGSLVGLLIALAAEWSVRHENVKRGRAEETLRGMEGRYPGLLEAAPDAMVVVNQSGEIVLLNVQVEKQFGYRADELVGQKVKDIIPEGFAERLIADGTRSAAEALTQQIGTGIELSGRRKDGSEFPVEIMLSPLESADGIVVTAAIRNITVRKKADLQLVQKVEELNRSNEELEQFSYVASHDLQEPLRMVASYTQLLASRYKGKLDADADEFISFAVDGCNRMQGLIQDLLAYSRSGMDGKVLHERSSENALNNALKNLSGTIEESGAVVTHDALPVITTDDTQLAQVFQNLVGNTIKYHGTAVPAVHISATRNDLEEWTFSVRDNGLGIEAQYFERIFILFQRLHGRTEFKGTGIGLAICKKIVEGLGGRIWVESQVGKGSTFYFALPGKDLKNDIDSNELRTHRSLVSRG
jgi:PAS domain S-box-containing protein